MSVNLPLINHRLINFEYFSTDLFFEEFNKDITKRFQSIKDLVNSKQLDENLHFKLADWKTEDLSPLFFDDNLQFWKNKLEIKEGTNERFEGIDIDKAYVYDERNGIEAEIYKLCLDDEKEGELEEKLETLDDMSFFNFRSEDDGEMQRELENLRGKKKLPYIQITESGLLKTTVDLFRLNSDIHSLNEFDITAFKTSTLFKVYGLHKLNGIKEVGVDYIDFYNGDKYEFKNNERSYQNSLGTLITRYERDKTLSQNYYWNKFMLQSHLSGFTNFDVQIKGKDYKSLFNVNGLNEEFDIIFKGIK